MCAIEGGTALSMPPSSNQLRDFVPLSRRCHRRRFHWSELRKESCLRDKRCGRSSSRPVEASILSAADHKIVCGFEEGCTSLEWEVRRKRRRALSRWKGSC